MFMLKGEADDQDNFDFCRPCVEEEDVNFDDALLGEPIVGAEQVVLDEHGPGALEPTPLASPTSLTPSQMAKHCLTHLPYCASCPICVAAKRPNTQHRRTNDEERVIPLLVADYCFVRSSGVGNPMQTILVMRLYPYRLFFACVVARKGVALSVTNRIVRSINETGLVQLCIQV